MYAIIETGGKQYKVTEGDTLEVELLDAQEGATVEIDKILAVVKDGQVIVGKPVVEGAKAVVKVLGHGKGEKVLIFKYKSKKNYRRLRGHRQPYTKIAVEKIVL